MLDKEIFSAKACLSADRLNYIHFNPCQPHWNLASSSEEYKWSSAKFYEKEIRDPITIGFDWLVHFNDS